MFDQPQNARGSAVFDHPILPTTIVGSYPQPDWLIDRERLKASLPPRVRAETLWRVPEPWLADAQEAATLMAIRDRSEEHTSELQSLMRISYAVFCLKKKKNINKYRYSRNNNIRKNEHI